MTMIMKWMLLVTSLAACSASTRIGGDDGGDDEAAAIDAGSTDPGPDASGGAFALLDEPSLVIIVGDSIAAGFNAANNNAPGGRGYGRLVVDNHAGYPAFAGRDIRTLAAGVEFRDLAESGANSNDAASKVRNASLPAVTGDVLVLINVGGNDFNDSIQTMLSPQATATAAANLRTNLADIVGRLRTRYEDIGAGKRVVFAIDTIHDPTDGTGSIPQQFDDGFCGTLQNPLFTPQLRMTALENLATMNAAIVAEAAAQTAVLVDVHAGFLGHGMNGTDRWMSNDCAHPTSDGHHHLRELVWSALGGP